MCSARRVGVFVPNAHPFGQGVVDGISTFCQVKGDWKLVLAGGLRSELFQNMAGDLHGIIGGMDGPDFAKMMQTWKKPCVAVSAALPDCVLPRVRCDHHAIGRAGAEHLLSLGFKRFAFCGIQYAVPHICQQAFEDTIRQSGCPCLIHQIDTATLDWPSIWKGVADWVASLPKPIALMAAKDSMALEVLDACRDLGIRVPDQVAVLGMGNEILLCQRANPRLSSIDPGFSRIGFHAASLLDDMMSGKPVPLQTTLMPPMGVVGRTSTDTFSMDDPHMAAVLRYIREHACDPMQVNDLLSVMPLSRRSMEMRFFQARGRSPHEEIRRIQLQRATRLLAQTHLPLDQVARASGFGDAPMMIKVFRKELGITPGEHRRRQAQVPAPV